MLNTAVRIYYKIVVITGLYVVGNPIFGDYYRSYYSDDETKTNQIWKQPFSTIMYAHTVFSFLFTFFAFLPSNICFFFNTYNFRLPYNLNTTPGYELTYIYSLFVVYAVVFVVVAVDSFFLGTCIHLTSCVKTFNDYLLEADKLLLNEW